MNGETPGRGRSALSRYLEATRAKRGHDNDAIPVREPGIDVEATDGQQQLWLHSEFASGSLIYNEPVTIHFHGELNVAAFERAFNQILQRHEAWRTGFRWSHGKLMQFVASDVSIPLPVTDLSSLPERRREARAIELATSDAKLPFDLSHPPLIRARLTRLTAAEHRLFLTLHHIIFDGYSLYQIFLPELQACYAAFINGTEPGLPPLRAQYPDYALCRKRSFADAAIEPHLRYWETQLAGPLPVLNLPLDRPRPAGRTFKGAMETFAVPPSVVERLKEFGAARGATLYMTVLAAFDVLLYSETHQCDVIVGSVNSSRKHPDTEKMLGYFLNNIVLRTKFSPEDLFPDLISRVRDVVLGALSHDEVPFELLVRRFEKQRQPGLHPLFQVMFSLEPPLRPLSPEWGFTQMDVETGVAKIDLCLELDERDSALIGRFIYSLDIWNELTISRLAKDWTILLSTISENPNRSIASLVRALRENRMQCTGEVPHSDGRSVWFSPKWLHQLWSNIRP